MIGVAARWRSRKALVGSAALACEPVTDHPGMQIASSREGSQLVIAIVGEIDLANADQLGELLSQVVFDTDTCVVLDIGGVSFIDSSFLRAVIVSANALAEQGTDLKVRNPTEQARRVFETTNLTHLLE
jgi:anti-anti-sigma factor